MADRYVVRATLAIANGRSVPDPVVSAFERLPSVMARADARAGRINRAVVDLAEAVLLAGAEGTLFPAVVTGVDARWVTIQLSDLPIVARLPASDANLGQAVCARLVAADIEARSITFEWPGEKRVPAA